ncbi:hypothetical protein HYE67_000182 [Fusarium culmorum]|uniref:Uncharacterized protein n=1 Tax=Fusarium culmorum TaxID=5516 RepID=A0A7S8CX95_FUSCU|nr:hypothetical protein HYE67_000182 [Fusarium culmorum]
MKFSLITFATAVPALAAAVPASAGTAQDKRADCKLTLQWLTNWSEDALRRYRVQLITEPRNDDHIKKYCDLIKADASGVHNVQCFWTDDGKYVIDESEGEGSPGHGGDFSQYLSRFNAAAKYFEWATSCDTVRNL